MASPDLLTGDRRQISRALASAAAIEEPRAMGALLEQLLIRYGAMVAAGDPEDLAPLADLKDTVERVLGQAVRGQLAADPEASWAAVARVLGMRKQSAWERFRRQG